MEQFVKQYVQTNEAIYNFIGEMSRRTMNLAIQYTLANKPFNGMAFDKARDELATFVSKGLEGKYSFSKISVQDNFVVAVQLSGEELDSYDWLAERLKHLIDAGFPTKAGTLMASLYLTGGQEHAERAFTLHKEMASYHPFLTDTGDIPISVFITQNEELHSKDVAARMHRYYLELKEHFRQGDALQLLSQLLVLWSPTYNEHLVPYVNQLRVEFKKRNVRISRGQYYLLGILALNTSDERVIEEVMDVYKQLIQVKLLKQNKEIALQIAVQKVIQQKAEELRGAVSGVGTRLNALSMMLQFLAQFPVGISQIIGDLPFFD